LTTKKTIFSWLVPKTIVARTTLMLFVGILIAQVLGTWLWVGQLKSSERKTIKLVKENTEEERTKKKENKKQTYNKNKRTKKKSS